MIVGLVVSIKSIKINIDLILFTNINSKWITGLIIKCKIIKILKANIRENLDDLGYGNDFSDIISGE